MLPSLQRVKFKNQNSYDEKKKVSQKPLAMQFLSYPAAIRAFIT